MSGLIPISEIEAFERVAAIPAAEVSDALRNAVTNLHEIQELEDFIRRILGDRAATPHGPAEIVDILTHKLRVGARHGLGAFVLKGRSYPTVRPKDIAHQIYRLEKIEGLSVAFLGTTGVVLDAVKEQFSSTCTRLGVNYAFLDADDFSRLFWAYGLMCPRDGAVLRGARCHCGYAPNFSTLNILQKAALDALDADRQLHRERGVIVLPTGAGKTRVAAIDAKRANAAKVLYVAHSNEILEVAESEFGAVFGSDHVGGVSQGAANSQVTTTTIQYLSMHPDFISKNLFDYVVIDEFHHAAAPTYRQLVRGLRPSYLLGMTATPFRGDSQDITQLCNGNVVVQYDLRSGIDTGILSPYHYFGCFDDVDYSDLKLLDKNFSISDLERRIIVPERHRAVIEKWIEKAEGRPTLAFCCSHRHALRVAEAFKAHGVSADTYLSDTPDERRKGLILELKKGDIKVLCVVDILNEGVDIPFVECLMFLRPTGSKRIFLQQLGRGLRKHLGKTHCTVIDFIGNFKNIYKVVEYHDLRTDDIDQKTLLLSRSAREILDLPLNCKVTFDDRVLDLFADQSHDLRHINRSNIGRILIHRYIRLCRRLGRLASSKDVDRNELLDSRFYTRLFGSWKSFVGVIKNTYPGELDMWDSSSL